MSISEMFRHKAAGRHTTDEGGEQWYDDQEQLHRDGDLPAETDPQGGKAYFRHGKLHRAGDKPAIEAANGDRAWYENGELSRKTGPAIIYADKTKEPEYWLDGQPMTDDQRAAIDPAFRAALMARNGDDAAKAVLSGSQRDVPILKPAHIQRRQP